MDSIKYWNKRQRDDEKNTFNYNSENDQFISYNDFDNYSQ